MRQGTPAEKPLAPWPFVVRAAPSFEKPGPLKGRAPEGPRCGLGGGSWTPQGAEGSRRSIRGPGRACAEGGAHGGLGCALGRPRPTFEWTGLAPCPHAPAATGSRPRLFESARGPPVASHRGDSCAPAPRRSGPAARRPPPAPAPAVPAPPAPRRTLDAAGGPRGAQEGGRGGERGGAGRRASGGGAAQPGPARLAAL